MKHIFIIGSKGVPSNYGGFETFVDNLVSKKKNDDIMYHVSCMSDENSEFEYNKAHCFNVKTPSIGPAKAVLYDIKAFKYVINKIKADNIKDAVIYILACRIGPFMKGLCRKAHKLGAKVYVNPDGHEFLRSKWPKPVKMYWKYSEKLMIKHADLIICDSKNIEFYIKKDYNKYNPKTDFIAYGADVDEYKNYDKEKAQNWYNNYNIGLNNYYLVVCRFVPENNLETIIKEFVSSDTDKDLVLITNADYSPFYKTLCEIANSDKRKRVKFVGTVYDKALLAYIRKNAYAYLHGHQVGGTNPSLLEALALTDLNILFDVSFNREVAEESALYFNKSKGNLKDVIKEADSLTKEQIEKYSKLAKKRISDEYSWDKIVAEYEQLFKGE